ncbi:MAG: glycosyltransferase family 2 protein [Candidatus Niyogibacteria bacterium]|nr:glycosyltransferase family 2 protein [Candidatus Niyogibacteria bacterium]
MKLSVIIPAYNEEGCIEKALRDLYRLLVAEKIDHEMVVIYRASSDRTEEILKALMREIPTMRYIDKPAPHGFGLALRHGLEVFSGDAVTFYMGDDSDSPEDLVLYFRTMEREGVDCVFGSRFVRGGAITGYPWIKYILNRACNLVIRVLFRSKYNDYTNAFKLYRRSVIEGTQPYIGRYFNFTPELVLKAISRGYTFRVVPNSWRGRRAGESNFKLWHMGQLYILTIFHCLLEKKLLEKNK